MATINATILAGQSLSSTIDLGTAKLLAVITPPQWTVALLSFQFSGDGVTFYDVSPGSTDQIFTMPCVPGRWVPVDGQIFPKGIKLKIHSGHPVQPIAQQADRVFTLVTE
jgi:hypothetical protein